MSLLRCTFCNSSMHRREECPMCVMERRGVPSSVVLAVDPAERSAADSWSTPQQSALTPPTPEQPAVTGEPTCTTCGAPLEPVDDLELGGYENRGRMICLNSHEENDGIPQTPSGPSRPPVESEGSVATQVELDIPQAFPGVTISPRDPGAPNVLLSPEDAAKISAGLRADDREFWQGHAASLSMHSTLALRLWRAFLAMESDLSSTRTALQRVREAARNAADALDRLATPTKFAPVSDHATELQARADYASGALDNVRRALTSTETDQ